MEAKENVCVIDCDSDDIKQIKINEENKITESKPKLNEPQTRKKFGVLSRNFFNKNRDRNTERTIEFMKKKKQELDLLQFGCKN